ncbi:MAG: hypothetical protein Q4G43_04290 [Mobilicoccus sp.]|nr:hypothetical protein [Mobilicoccus sp.]
MSVRVYLAAGPAGVESLRRDGVCEAPTFAVTPQLRETGADEEDLEYEVFRIAEDVARAAGEVVVVVAADVPENAVTWSTDGVGVQVGPVPLRAVVSLHVEEDGAGPDDELLWYDAAELDDVAALLA